MVLARLVNRPESLKAIGYPYDGMLPWYRDKIQEVGGILKPFWGNAYVVTTHGQAIDKLTYLIGLLKGAHKVLPLSGVAGTCAAYHGAFKTLEGFSDFMAAQVVADLKNTSFHPLAIAEDWWTFAAPGPGSLRGMAWYFGKSRIAPREFQECLREIRNDQEDMGSEIIHKICNQDLQNCLCEFDKYMRVSRGTGRSKRRYNGC